LKFLSGAAAGAATGAALPCHWKGTMN